MGGLGWVGEADSLGEWHWGHMELRASQQWIGSLSQSCGLPEADEAHRVAKEKEAQREAEIGIAEQERDASWVSGWEAQDADSCQHFLAPQLT